MSEKKPEPRRLVNKVAVVAIIALLIGIGVGLAITGPSSQGEVSRLSSQLAQMQKELDAAKKRPATAQTMQNPRLTVPVAIPLLRGFAKGGEVFYITTEASDNDLAEALTRKTNFRVVFTPVLAAAPKETLDDMYVFTNGISGSGTLGFQPDIFGSVPGDEDYSPAWIVNHVTWKPGAAAKELRSEKDVRDAESAAQVTVTKTKLVVNCPFIKWPGGHMKIAKDPNVTDDTPYGEAQVLKIDTAAMKVVFKAHRGWARDGATIYYIVTDSSAKMPADDMGVLHTPRTQKMIGTPAGQDLFQFTNGIKGSGPMGFQAGIGVSRPGDRNYSPFWSIMAVTWKNPERALLLESLDDLTALSDLVKQEPMMGGFIVNCPFVPVR